MLAVSFVCYSVLHWPFIWLCPGPRVGDMPPFEDFWRRYPPNQDAGYSCCLDISVSFETCYPKIVLSALYIYIIHHGCRSTAPGVTCTMNSEC